MTSIKKLRNIANKLLTKNINSVHGNSIRSMQKTIDTGRASKLEGLIKTLSNIGKKQEVNPLDEGIEEEEKKVEKKKFVTKKDVKTNTIKKEKYVFKPITRKPYFYTGVSLIQHTDARTYIDSKTQEKKQKKYIKRHEFNVKVWLSDAEKADPEEVKKMLLQELQLVANVSEFNSSENAMITGTENVSSISGADFEKTGSFIQHDQIKMQNATYARLDIEGLKEYDFTPFKCVYGALKHRYGFTEEYCYSVFKDANKAIDIDGKNTEFKITDGVSTQHLLFLAERKDFSMYAMDQYEKVFVKHISRNNNLKPLVFVMHNKHFYLIEDDKQISHITHTNAERDHTSVSSLFRDYEVKNTFHLPIHENVDIEELKNYKSCNIIYSTNNLYMLLCDIYALYNYEISSKNIKLSGHNITYIYFKLFDIHIYADVNYDEETNISWKNVKEICEKIGILYNNQPISSVMLEHEKNFFKLRSVRVALTADEKKVILDKNENKCQLCKKQVKKGNYQFDHIIPLAAGGSNKTDNIQLLCRECHFNKTAEEQQNGDYVYINPSESSYNMEVKKIMTSELAKNWAFIEKFDGVAKPKGWITLHVDGVKYRRNIIIYNKELLPVYTVMEKPEPFKATDVIVCGSYYVECDAYMPMRGNGWYMHNTIKYCIAEGIMQMSDIKYKLLPSMTIPANHYRAFMESVVNTFGDLAKAGPNAFIGCFNKRDSDKTTLSMTSYKVDAQNTFLHRQGSFVKYEEKINVWFTYTKQSVQFDETRGPLYKFIVEQEAIEAHKLITAIEKMGGIVAGVNTDCVKAYFKNDVEINAFVNNTYWDEEKTTKKYKFEDKVEGADQAERMKNKKRTEKYEYMPLVWNKHTDNNNNDFEPLVKMIIESGKSWCIDGAPGTGKSHLTKMILKQTKKAIALAPTNKACRVINGQTIHKFVACVFTSKQALLNKLKNVEYIIVDEISMVKEIFYKVFMAIKKTRTDIKFIFVGDFNQLAPVNDRVENCDYANSSALFELCDGNKLSLLKCRRSNDDLFNIARFETIDKLDIKQFGKVFTKRHICFTNKKRIEINNIMMKQYKDELAKQKKKCTPVFVKKLAYDGNSQDVFLLSGMPVIARINNKGMDISNNETFTIKEVNDTHVTLSGEGKAKTISTKSFNTLFNVAYAITTHKSQGATFNHPYTIHEWDRFSKQMKYVAITRATNKSFINIL